MKAENQVKAVQRNKPWAFLQAIAGAVAGVFNQEIRRNKLPGKVEVTGNPDNGKIELIPITRSRGKVESKRAVQWASVASRKFKGKALGI